METNAARSIATIPTAACSSSFAGEVVVQRKWILHAWVLMSNHYHLLFATPGGWPVPRHEMAQSGVCPELQRPSPESGPPVPGTLQGNSGGARIPPSGARAIHRSESRPVPHEEKTVRLAGDDEWSNYRATAGLETPPPWLETGWRRAGRWISFIPTIVQRPMKRIDDLWPMAGARPTSPGRIWWGGCFSAALHSVTGCSFSCGARSGAVSIRGPSEISSGRALSRRVEKVEWMFAITTEELRQTSRGHARKALAQLALDDGGLTLRGVAEWLGVSAWAVAKMRRTARDLHASSPMYRARLERIRTALS